MDTYYSIITKEWEFRVGRCLICLICSIKVSLQYYLQETERERGIFQRKHMELSLQNR
jgi:hypothetical protein